MPDVPGNPSLRSVLFAGAGILAGLVRLLWQKRLHDNQTKATTADGTDLLATLHAHRRSFVVMGVPVVTRSQASPARTGLSARRCRLFPSASISPACWRTIPTISSPGSFRRSRFRRKARCQIQVYRSRRRETSPPTFTNIDHGCGVGKGGIDLI
jgi:hypothetical protein